MDTTEAGRVCGWLENVFPSETASLDRSTEAESSKGESREENNVIVDVTVGDNLSIDGDNLSIHGKGEDAAATEHGL